MSKYTLRCGCGGNVVCTGGSENDGVVMESYECVACGLTGRFRENMRTGEKIMSGCLRT